MIVVKFGGTSLRNAEWIARALTITEERLGESPVLVASAIGDTTNLLEAMIEQAALGELEGAQAVIDTLHTRHRAAIQQLLPNENSHRCDATTRVQLLIERLRSAARVLVQQRRFTGRTRAHVLPIGEDLSTTIIHFAAKERGRETTLLDSRRLIVTDAEHENATPDVEKTAARVLDAIPPRPNHLYVAQGFVASTETGEETLLGRGGSDYSASLIGAALSAERIEIWSDVDGIMTCDPRIVPAARVIPRLNYPEAAELAYFGARVLHPSTIKPAMDTHTPVLVKNTGKPELEGSRIDSEGGSPGVRALARKDNITLVTIQSLRMINAYGFLAKIFTVFDHHRIPVDLLSTSEVSVSLTVNGRAPLTAPIAALKKIGNVSLEHDMSIVCVVGRQIWRDPQYIARAFAALNLIPVRLISLGASDTNLSIVIPSQRSLEVVRLLHAEFFE